MTEWQPIETAPAATPDLNKRVLVYAPYWKEPVGLVLTDGDWWRMQKRQGNAHPTHWMPLPAPPKEGGE